MKTSMSAFIFSVQHCTDSSIRRQENEMKRIDWKERNEAVLLADNIIMCIQGTKKATK